jgi:hypothetical protein
MTLVKVNERRRDDKGNIIYKEIKNKFGVSVGSEYDVYYMDLNDEEEKIIRELGNGLESCDADLVTQENKDKGAKRKAELLK